MTTAFTLATMIHIFADLHLHPHQNHATILPTGRNSRLQDGVTAAKVVINSAKSGDTLLFAGDWFESQTEVPTDALDASRELVDLIKVRGLQMVMITGNHDQLSNDGMTHSLGLFHQPALGLEVIDRPVVKNGWAFLPFRRIPDMQKALLELDVAYRSVYGGSGEKIPLVCHTDMLDAVTNSGRVSTRGIGVMDIPSWVSVAFSGHYHRNQIIGNRLMYVGSPYQITAGESGETKVFVSMAEPPSTFGEVTLTEIAGLPTFETISLPEWDAIPESDRRDKTKGFLSVQVPHDHRGVIDGVRTKRLPKPSLDHQRSVTTIDGATEEYFTQIGRTDLIDQARAFL